MNMYYQSQYTSYNFAVHNITTQEASMFLWHVVIAERGLKKIVSCLLKYVVSNFTPLKPNEERKLIIWSYRFVGKNNDWTTLKFIRIPDPIRILFRNLSKISDFPCDRGFTFIERQKKKNAASQAYLRIKYVIYI